MIFGDYEEELYENENENEIDEHKQKHDESATPIDRANGFSIDREVDDSEIISEKDDSEAIERTDQHLPSTVDDIDPVASDDDLIQISRRLWELDVNRIPEAEYTLDAQRNTSKSSKNDDAPGP